MYLAFHPFLIYCIAIPVRSGLRHKDFENLASKGALLWMPEVTQKKPEPKHKKLCCCIKEKMSKEL